MCAQVPSWLAKPTKLPIWEPKWTLYVMLRKRHGGFYFFCMRFRKHFLLEEDAPARQKQFKLENSNGADSWHRSAKKEKSSEDAKRILKDSGFSFSSVMFHSMAVPAQLFYPATIHTKWKCQLSDSPRRCPTDLNPSGNLAYDCPPVFISDTLLSIFERGSHRGHKW